MGQRRIGQASLAAALLPAGAGSNRRLERIAGLIDRLPMERLLASLRVPTDRPGYPPLALFRAALAERGLAEALFAELNRQLDAKRLVLKAGTLIDATLVEASVARPPTREGEVSIRDPEAGFTRRGQRSFFGFEAHRLSISAPTWCAVPSRPAPRSVTASRLMPWWRATKPRCSPTRSMTASLGERRWPRPALPTPSCIAAMLAAGSRPGSAG
jgi:IS5 family transposase